MTEAAPAPVQPEPGAAPTPADSTAAANPTNPKPAEPVKGDEFKSEESKQAVLADLAKERDARQALEKKIEDQNKALAAAFGLTEEPKSGDDLTETVNALKARLDASERTATKLAIAAEYKIPAEHHDLLTETDTEKLKAQAEKVGALIAAASPGGEQQQNPAFVANPGQGQGGPTDPSAAEAAEYERFYPSTPNGK